MTTSTPTYTTESVKSVDGTTIGYRQVGKGPGIVIWAGGTQGSQHYARMANALAPDFTVYSVDRRGRTLSGPHGSDYGIRKEVEDIEAVLRHTGSRFLFGHSSGALVALEAGRTLVEVEKVAVFEPPLSTDGSISWEWIPQFDREIAANDPGAAMVTFIKADHLTSLPRWLLVPMMRLYVKNEKRGDDPNDMLMRELIPTQRYDGLLVRDMDNHLDTFRTMRPGVLLMGGAKSPKFLGDVLRDLECTLPHARRIEYPDLAHSAPNETRSNRPGPERVAADLKLFFSYP